MPSERVQRRIDRLLDQAEEAVEARDWESVRDAASAVFRVDPDNEDAKSFLQMAGDEALSPPDELSETPAPSAAQSADTPTSFANGRYEVTGFLGEGGKKRVYLAHDTTLDRDVAFALIKAEGLDDASRQRITREAQAMARLGDNPNIMPIFDLGEENGQPYMVGPLMGGGDVEALIENAEDGRLSLEDALRIASEICHGLEFAHSKSIIHRDLKPGNVWLTEDGTARIGDFGLAISLDRSRLTQEKMMVGTVSYMPPEQATGGEVTPRSDLYSLGAMLYEMVTGRTPFMGDDEIAIIGQHINTPPVAPQWHRPEIPAQLDSLIMRLLSKNPAERPDSAGDVLSALGAIDATPREVPADTGPGESGSLDSMAGGVFVGRHREMDQLKAMLENALSGRGGMVTLVGEPGIGKSRTALELETYAGLRNVQVLWGKCYEGGGAPPYWPWVQAIRSFVSSHEPQEVRSQMGSTASVIAEIVADVKESLPDVQPPPTLDDPESARFRLFDSVATFLKNAGNVQPIVLVLDDLHWADGPSLKMLEFVARELASSRVMLIGTYRDMELNRRHPLSVTLGDLTREHLFERVLLRGLTREDIARFIEIAAGIDPPRGLVDAVTTQTEGNPLFVTETVRLLIQEGELQAETLGDRDSWTVRIPEGVREVIGRRLDKLSERCNEILTTASVIGRQFSLDQMKTLSEDVTEDRLLDVLDEALAAQVIQELPDRLGWYEFSHALIQETLAEELSATRTVRVHARIAEALESLYGDEAHEHAEELVGHFAEAETVLGTDKLVEYSLAAGETALGAYAYEEAAKIYERALEAYAPNEIDQTRAELLFGIARADFAMVEFYGRGWEAFLDAFGYFEKTGQNSMAFRVASHIPAAGLRLPQQSVLTERLLALVEKDTVEELYAQMWHAWMASVADGDIDRATPHIERALTLLDSIGDDDQRVFVLGRVSAIHGNYLRWDDVAAAALSILGVDSEQEARGVLGLYWGSMAFQVLGNVKSGEEAANTLLASGERLHHRGFMLLALIRLASARLAVGDWHSALDHMARIEGSVAQELKVSQTLLIELMSEGDPDRLEEIALQLTAYGLLAKTEDPRLGVATGSAVLALTGWVANRADFLDRAGEQAKAILGASPPPVPVNRQFAEVALAVCALAAGDLEEAGELYGSLKIATGQMIGGHLISGDRMLGLLASTMGDTDLAEKHFEAGIEFCEKAGYRPELAWTCADYAKFLVGRNSPGDREKATELQDEAIAIGQELGMKLLLERVLAQREILKA